MPVLFVVKVAVTVVTGVTGVIRCSDDGDDDE